MDSRDSKTRRRIVIAVFALGAWSMGLDAEEGRAPSASVSERTVLIDAEGPRSWIDSPQTGETVSGYYTASGWALDATGVSEWYVAIDGSSAFGTKAYGGWRGDACQVHADLGDPNCPYVGWSIQIDTRVLSEGAHTLAITWIDAWGNWSTRSVTFNVDNQGPSLFLSSPGAGERVRGTRTISASASDASGVSRVDFRVNGSRIAIDLSPPYSASWDTTTQGVEGSNTISVVARDTVGNFRVVSRNVTVDNTGPSIGFDHPGSFLRGTRTLAASASDGSGVQVVRFYVDGVRIAGDSSPPYSVSWNTAGVADGSHTLVARAWDSLGNQSASTTRTVTVDNTPPTVSLVSPSPGSEVGGDVTLQASASDGHGVERVEFLVDGAPLSEATAAPYLATWSTAGLAEGSHAVAARATDRAGNTASASTTVTLNNSDFFLRFVPVQGLALSTRGIEPGGSTELSVEVVREDGTSDPVSLSAVGFPPEVDVSLPASRAPGLPATLAMTAAPDAGDAVIDFEIRGSAGGETFSLPGTLVIADLPNVTSVTPQEIPTGAVTTVTLEGTDLAGLNVWVATEPPSADWPARVYPTASVASVNAAGTRAQIQVDATGAGIEGFYNLALSTPSGGGAATLRVLPNGPVVEFFTPARPSEGDVYMFMVTGANLAGATVTPTDPNVRVVELDNSGDMELLGVLEVLPGAQPASQVTVSKPGGGSVAVPVAVQASPSSLDTFNTITGHAVTDPGILLQQFDRFLEPAPPPPDDPVDPIFTFECGTRFRKSLSWNLRVRISDLLERVGADVFKDLPRDVVSRIDLKLLEVVSRVEIRTIFRCGYRSGTGVFVTDTQVCASGALRTELIGVGGHECSFNACAGGGGNAGCREVGPAAGLSSFSVDTTTQCTEAVDRADLSTEGDRKIDVEQVHCCTDTVTMRASGTRSIGGTFPEIEIFEAPTEPEPESCEPGPEETADYVVVSWIDEAPVKVLEQTLRPQANILLRNKINFGPIGCLDTFAQIASGFTFLIIQDDIDRQYVNAFTFAHGGDSPPPGQFMNEADLLTFRNGKRYRQMSRLNTTYNGATVSIEDTFAVGGRTKEPCTGFYLPAIFPFKVERHPENGAFGVRNGHAYLLNSFRVGLDGQLIDHRLNAKPGETQIGDTTPWIWSVIRVDAEGGLDPGRKSHNLLIDTQIFNTFSVYRREDTAWTRMFDTQQDPVEDFIDLSSSSQRREEDIP